MAVEAREAVPTRRCHALAIALQLHELGDACAAAASTGATAGTRSGSVAFTDNEATSAVVTTAAGLRVV